MNQPALTPELLLEAYASGYFPMAESSQSTELFWFHPDPRCIIPLDRFHTPTRFARWLKKQSFTITTNTAFDEVMRACTENRRETWINEEILFLYSQLHAMGYAHSVEVWDEQRKLIGGIYGVALGGAFCGESMFSRSSGGSKIALLNLLSRLHAAGYTLFDTQFMNPHLVQFGATEIPRTEYLKRLRAALKQTPKIF